MTARRWVIVGAALAACSSKRTPKIDDRPLSESIVGLWDDWCASEAEATSTCLGRDPIHMTKTFGADGSVEIGVEGRNDPPMRGTWSATGHDLVLTFSGGNVQLVERYRARIEDGRLVLWKADSGFGRIYGRHGEPFEPVASAESSSNGASHRIDGIHYTLDLPDGYRLARDDHHRQRWEPSSGSGLVVELRASARREGEACSSGVSSSSETIDRVERKTTIGIAKCSHTVTVDCDAGHTRGYLEPAENDAALALCKSLSVHGE